METVRLVQPNEIWTLGQMPDAASLEAFKSKLYSWIEFNAITPEIITANVEETENRLIDSMYSTSIPQDYKYDMYSMYRTPAEQIQAYADGWEAVPESRHVIGKAVDVHIYKNGQRVRGEEMKQFYYEYIDGKLPDFDFTKLYDWGFHAHWEGDLHKKLGIGALALVVAAIYYLFKK
jgi:hypothetical protein